MLKQGTEVTSPEDLARLGRALSVETRVRMLGLLGGRAMCVGALARALGVTDAAVSQHLRVLRDAGLVVAERRGHFVHYTLDPGAVDRWQSALEGLLATPDTPGELRTTCEEKRRGEERR